MKLLHRFAQRVLGWVDAWYYRRYKLQTLGPVLFVGRAQYHGPELRFEDGTLLRENDYIGRLHFNNASIAALGEGSMHRVGFRFAKLMRESLRKLAEAAHNDPAFAAMPISLLDERLAEARQYLDRISEQWDRALLRLKAFVEE